MDFHVPENIRQDLDQYRQFLREHMAPELSRWNRELAIPRSFFALLGENQGLGYDVDDDDARPDSTLKQALQMEAMARLSPGVAVAVLVQMSLGMQGLWLYGTADHKGGLLRAAARGKTLVCVGNTEMTAGSDVANVQMEAKEVPGGWRLNGTKAYVTNGSLADWAVVTAVTDPERERNRRMSLFLVDLNASGVTRKKLNKRVWIPSDLTRLHFDDVLVPSADLMGKRGRGLQQILDIFTHSRVTISALTLGTAAGAFDLGLEHAMKRKLFGKKLVELQAKSFEFAHHYARIEAARMMVLKACAVKDAGSDFRMEASLAKYLAVDVAREVGTWAADLFGAASVMFEHPVHKFPMDAWAAALGEGTQDVQKLIIFRELLKRRGLQG